MVVLLSCDGTGPSDNGSCPEPIYNGRGYNIPSAGLLPLGVCQSKRIVYFTLWPTLKTAYLRLEDQKFESLDSAIITSWRDSTEFVRITHVVVSPLDQPRVLVSATVRERDGRFAAAFYVFDLQLAMLSKLEVPKRFNSIDLYRVPDATARVWTRMPGNIESTFQIGGTWFDMNAAVIRSDPEDRYLLSQAFVDADNKVKIRSLPSKSDYSIELYHNGRVIQGYDNIKAVSNVVAISPDSKSIVFEVGVNSDTRDPNLGRRIMIVRHNGTSYKVESVSAPWLSYCLFARNPSVPTTI